MRNAEDDKTRARQVDSLFNHLNEADHFLVCAITANPDDPRVTFRYLKHDKVSDKDLIIILRSLAERIENGTVKIALEDKPEGLEIFKH